MRLVIPTCRYVPRWLFTYLLLTEFRVRGPYCKLRTEFFPVNLWPKLGSLEWNLSVKKNIFHLHDNCSYRTRMTVVLETIIDPT